MEAEAPIGASATPHNDPRRDRSALEPPIQRVKDRNGPGAWTRRIDDDSHLIASLSTTRSHSCTQGRNEALRDGQLIKLPGDHQLQAQEMHIPQQQQGSGQKEGATYLLADSHT